MIISNHAVTRCQQRGIKNQQVDLILEHGTLKSKSGAYECYIPKKIIGNLISEYKRKIQDLENISRANKTLILNENTIITGYNKRNR
jgi:hypothetical protein